MRVHLIKRRTIEDYVTVNAGSRSSFDRWLGVIKYSDWNEPLDIVGTFGSADVIGNSTNRVVFNVGGNNYRVICKYVFGQNQVQLFICWLGTHAEYDRLCRQNRQYTVNAY